MREHLYFPYAIHILFFFLFKGNVLKLLTSGSYFESVSPLLLLNKQVYACMSSQPRSASIKLLKSFKTLRS